MKRQPHPRQGERALSTAQLLAFGFPAMTHSFVALPIYSILPTYYAANTAVTLAQIGVIAGVSRIVDAVNDPVIGFLSDRTRTRFGSRKPWLFGAIIFCVAAIGSLFSPPATATWLYFFLWSQLLYTGFTMFEVPRSAWGIEVSRNYDERTRVGTFVALFNIAGSLAFFSYPIIASAFTGSSKIDGSTLAGISLIYMVLMPIGVLTCLAVVPKGERVEGPKIAFRDIARSVLKSPPARLFYSITVLWGLGQGAFVGVSFIFYTDYMKMAEFYPYIMATLFISEIIFLPLWSRLLRRFDRHRAWALCMAGGALFAPAILLIPPGGDAIIALLALVVVRGFFTAPTNFLPGAVLGDVVDYDSLRSGQGKAGNLFAVQMVLIKIAMAVGGGVAFLILDFAQFKVGGANGATAFAALIGVYIGLPMVLHLSMAALAWRFPIDRRRQGVIRRALQRRQKRASLALVPAQGEAA